MQQPQRPNQPQEPQPMAPPPQQAPSTQVGPPPANQEKRFGLAMFLPAILAAVVALVAGIGIGAWGGGGWVGGAGGGDRTTAAPAPIVTVTVTAPGEGGGAPTEEPTQEPGPEPTEATFNPKQKDFKVGIKILKTTCYGELGCDVNFRIIPSYVGSQSIPAEGKTEVTYEVIGGTDPITNTFEVDGEGTVTFDEDESAKTASASKKLVARVTVVTYNEFG